MKETNKTMMQYFEWYMPNNCALWNKLIRTAPDLKKKELHLFGFPCS